MDGKQLDSGVGAQRGRSAELPSSSFSPCECRRARRTSSTGNHNEPIANTKKLQAPSLAPSSSPPSPPASTSTAPLALERHGSTSTGKVLDRLALVDDAVRLTGGRRVVRDLVALVGRRRADFGEDRESLGAL